MNYARVLTNGVGGWLSFEAACNRSGLFSEKYLAQPVGQILSAWSGNRALAEFKHPVLAPLALAAGRRPEVDFVVLDAQRKIILAVESKWIGATAPSIDKILWDLIRLELLAHHTGARCFFLLGGKRGSLDKLFAHSLFRANDTNGRLRPLLRHDNNVIHRTTLAPTVRARIPMLRKLFTSYQDIEFPHFVVSRRRRAVSGRPQDGVLPSLRLGDQPDGKPADLQAAKLRPLPDLVEQRGVSGDRPPSFRRRAHG